jgi:hypothetical protein
MKRPYDADLLQAFLCALLVRSGGKLTLTVKEINEAHLAYGVFPESDWLGETLTLALEARPGATPSPPPQSQGRRVRQSRVREI